MHVLHTSSINVSPSATTTYTVTGTNTYGCSGLATKTVYVFSPPTVSVTPKDTGICSGENVTLTASGASSYSWSPATGLSCTGCANPVATPSVTTTYTVIGTSAGGCSDTDTVTVTIDSVIAPMVTGPDSACIDTALYYITNPQGGYTYSWSSIGTNTVTGTGTSAKITNLFGTGGKVVFYATNGGCTKSDTLTVASCCSGTFTAPITIFNDSSSNYPDSLAFDNILINGTFTVDRSIRITSCDVELGPSAMIEILPGDTLYIDKYSDLCSHFHAACDYMWRGIFIQPRGVLVSRTLEYNYDHQETLIEDADSAVVALNGTGQSKYIIDSTYFNKCYKDIVVEPMSISGTYSSIATDNVFTCRNLAGYPCRYSIKDTVTAPFDTLIAPHSGERTAMGVDVHNVPAIVVNRYGVFDNMHYGIYCRGSNLTVLQDTMQNIADNVSNGAIWFIGGASNTNRLRVGGTASNQPCTFNNCYIGIVADSGILSDSIINNNFNLSYSKINYGGIREAFAMNSSNKTLIKGNRILNYTTGIIGLRNRNVNDSILENYIYTPICGNISKGIVITEVSTPAGAKYAIVHDSVYGSVCISASGVKYPYILSNTAILNPDGGGCPPTNPETGISVNVVQQLWNNDTLMGNGILHKFYDSIMKTSLGQLMVVDTMLQDTTNIGLASALVKLSGITPTNNIEENMKTVDGIYLKSILYNNGQLTPTQVTSLQSIANKCPFEDGNAVYDARAMLFLYEPLRIYEDYCGSVDANARYAHETDTVQGIDVTIYPNPNNGSFTLDYQLGKNQTGKVYIYTLTGTEVGEYTLSSDNGKMAIVNQNLSNGIYFYKLVTSDNTTREGKIVIIR